MTVSYTILVESTIVDQYTRYVTDTIGKAMKCSDSVGKPTNTFQQDLLRLLSTQTIEER
jgi:hypothetical protein